MTNIEILVAISIVLIVGFCIAFFRIKMKMRKEKERKMGYNPSHKMESLRGEEAKKMFVEGEGEQEEKPDK